MEIVYAQADGWKTALQAEVTRMERENENERLRSLWLESEAQNSEFRGKLAALEAQEPVARVTVGDINAIYWLVPTHGATFNTPLYLAAGANPAPTEEPKP